MKKYTCLKTVHDGFKIPILILLLIMFTGCGNDETNDAGDTSRNLRESIIPKILSARLIDSQGNDIETQVNDVNIQITPQDGQKIGFEISFIAGKGVEVEVIVSQYTDMDLRTENEPVFCEGDGCPIPEKGEIPYYGEEIFYEFGNNSFFPIAPYDGPRKYTVPPLPENGEELNENTYAEVEKDTHIEYFFQRKNYYTIEGPSYRRMFRFQIEDRTGYISKDHVIYTNIPL